MSVENQSLFGEMNDNSFVSENDGGEDESNDDDYLAIHMDLSQPIAHLQSLVENLIGLKLNDYSFWLQDSQIVSNRLNFLVAGSTFIIRK